MNKIKFRIWKVDDRKWKTIPQEYVGTRCAHRCMATEQPDNFCVFSLNSTERTIHQLSTGLLDKLEREVYEGDIIFWESRQMKCQVLFRNCQFICKEILAEHTGYEELLGLHTPIEIIGNIFENPELIL